MSTTSVRDGRQLTASPTRDAKWASLAIGCMFTFAAVLSAALNTAAPFEHGWWLVAYLSLVGGIAQMLLGTGQYVLAERTRARKPPEAVLLTELALWSSGTIAVAAGELAGTSTVLLLGSAALLFDLTLFAGGLRRLHNGAAAPAVVWEGAYAALLLFLAVSVLVGSSLAGALPG